MCAYMNPVKADKAAHLHILINLHSLPEETCESLPSAELSFKTNQTVWLKDDLSLC